VQAVFDKLSYSHRREYVHWVEEAKKPETRARRIDKTIEMLMALKKEAKKIPGESGDSPRREGKGERIWRFTAADKNDGGAKSLVSAATVSFA
jgi:hypothetical protein